MGDESLFGNRLSNPHRQLRWLLSLSPYSFCFYATQGVFYAMPATFMKGKPAAVGIAAINCIALLGGLVGPFWMGLMKDWTGSYRIGLITLAVPSLVGAGMTLFLRSRALEGGQSPAYSGKMNKP